MNNSTALVAVGALGDLTRQQCSGALICGSQSNAAPGRMLNHAYSSLGHAIESKANRSAHALGLGPMSIAEHIDAFFDAGEQRMVKLEELQMNWSPWLEKRCSKLVEYSLPQETARTQVQAFRSIVTIITRYPVTRTLLLKSKHLGRKRTNEETIAALWARSDDSHPREWSFYCNLAATCLAETDISGILANIPCRSLGSIQTESGALSVIERLLVALECGVVLTVSGALVVKYLAGILEMPTFWLGGELACITIFKKLLGRLILLMKDLGIDSEESLLGDTIFDNEGIDSLACSILTGVLGWSTVDPKSQTWFRDLAEVVHLIRRPQAETLLTRSWDLATGPDFLSLIPDTEPSTLVILTLAWDQRS
ncbi:hypothetical protein DFH07DRAFT_511330 [Mycena maculata]|uniref:Uncharacterized protein n=1 Tax=Mycena maculata TaxID=230809 RepID=A0AAD7NB20_9AGAR|nr:hypothetical protein DFH07DRAFT_511330 [Mycena maculata]